MFGRSIRRVAEIQRIPEDLGSASTPVSVSQIGDAPRSVAYDGVE
jgi:hypothetical protein